jgi:hypothetical protein
LLSFGFTGRSGGGGGEVINNLFSKLEILFMRSVKGYLVGIVPVDESDEVESLLFFFRHRKGRSKKKPFCLYISILFKFIKFFSI